MKTAITVILIIVAVAAVLFFLPLIIMFFSYKRGYRRINGSGKQAYQNDNTENGRTKTKHNTHKLGNLGYGIYENCVLCNNP